MNISRMPRRRAIFAIVAALACACMTLTASPLTQAHAQNVRIFVNGTEMHFDQPPIERNNRVFVPLRGVFERLGATVVYYSGQINATGNGRSVHLTIGSTAALVNGNPVTIDVAPYVIGGRTLVPLRFISQSLGATVDYNYSTQVVTVISPGQSAGITLINMNPGSGAVVASNNPTIRADFSAAVDPNTIRITLDGRDVSATTEIASHYFVFVPPYNLAATQHTVRVTGRAANGISFDQSWSFTSGTTVIPNYIHNLSPADGATVTGSFTIAGTTLPNSHVHIAAASTASFGGLFVIPQGSYSADLTADGNGAFSQAVSLQVASGGSVTARVTSTAPTTHAAAQVTVHYHT